MDGFAQLLSRREPILALAPMQDVTDLPFWKLMVRYGGADLYYTEYFRVYANSCLDKHILRSITQNPTGRPVVAQMIGNDVTELVRIARELLRHPIAAVDLNLGCPAPVVYRKCAGGGLLRDPEQVDAIVGSLRDAVHVKFTIKTRVGFDDARHFERLLEIFAKHNVDLVTVHGRTVREMYRSAVNYDLIARAVDILPCPVLANGNVHSPENAAWVLQRTGARGLMIGRGAIRNPWLFEQIRQHLRGEPLFIPRGRQVLQYVRDLFEAVLPAAGRRDVHVQKMKRYMNFIGLAVDEDGQFLHAIRRVNKERDFFAICEEFLNHDEPMPLTPLALPLKDCDVLAGEHC